MINGDSNTTTRCNKHPLKSSKYYCHNCHVNICDECRDGETSSSSCCSSPRLIPVAAVSEQLRQSLDSSFTTANNEITSTKTQLESRLKSLAEEKDRALLQIESAFESYCHTVGRRATLLKNKVIDIYNENAAMLESGLEEIDTAMTCVVSLRDFYNSRISQGDFTAFNNDDDNSVVGEIEEVSDNITHKVRPPDVHIVFDDQHGVEKFRSSCKDLGRVVSNRDLGRVIGQIPTSAGASGDNNNVENKCGKTISDADAKLNSQQT